MGSDVVFLETEVVKHRKESKPDVIFCAIIMCAKVRKPQPPFSDADKRVNEGHESRWESRICLGVSKKRDKKTAPDAGKYRRAARRWKRNGCENDRRRNPLYLIESGEVQVRKK